MTRPIGRFQIPTHKSLNIAPKLNIQTKKKKKRRSLDTGIDRLKRKERTFSTGRVKKAATMAAARKRRTVILRAETQENAMENLLRQGLQASSSSMKKSGSACLRDKRGLKPPRFARFGVFGCGDKRIVNTDPSFPSSLEISLFIV